MKPSALAKVIPGIVLAICAFSLAYWFSGSRRAGNVSERVPEPASETAAPLSPPIGPVTNSPMMPGPTAQLGGQPAAQAVQIPALPGSWPRFRGANFDNISQETTPLADAWKPGQPGIIWALDMGEGHAGAAIANSRVYVLDYDRAQQADVLRCLSLADGGEIWRYAYPVSLKRNHGMSRTVPAVSAKYVVTLGPKCHVLCADPMTGRLYWMIDLVRQFGATVPPWYAGQCPLIDSDRAIIAPGGGALMIAIDCATGKILWRTPNPDGWSMTHSSIVPMDFKGRRMYVYCASGGVVGVDAQTGAVLWKTNEWTVKIANVPTPVIIGDGRIFLTGGYDAGSMMIRIGRQGGRFTVEPVYRLKPSVFGSDQQTPIYYEGYIYGVIPGGQLACLDPNGKLMWTSGGTNRFGIGPYLIAGDKIYVMNDTGVLTMAAAAPSGYKQLAQAKILNGHDSWGPMALAGGRLIARDLTRMVCVDIGKH